MATYFHQNTDMQSSADGLQTLLLINPTAYAQYSTDAPPPPSSHGNNNVIFLNSSAPAANLSHTPPTDTQHQFVGVPLPAAAQDYHANSRGRGHQETAPYYHGFMGRVQHTHPWNPLDPRMAAAAAAAVGCETPRSSQQVLSLSLSSQQPNYSGPSMSRASHAMSGDDVRMTSGGGSSSMSVSGSVVTNRISDAQNLILGSKYLKAAQELLDEVVNVGNGIEGLPLRKRDQGKSSHNKAIGEPSQATNNGDSSSGGGGEAKGKGEADLSASERQEIQIKKAKLVDMLEEVEQRYRQYHQRMQMAISSFEQVAGIDSSKSYTSLALRTISKQFRCLKDAITGQIRAVNKSLGEEDSLGGKPEGSRFKFVDQHIRQQRALQQLGMIQHNAWRPQRGLPERAVSVLRAWLFEHFLHPYPKDSDKQMLAKQTGLTRSQVSNWFINARVRLWKPMVEEMYLEETKEQEKQGSADKASKSEHDEGSAGPQDKNPITENYPKNFISKQDSSISQSAPSIRNSTGSSSSPAGGNIFSHIAPSLFDGITPSSPKKLRTTEMLHPSDGVQPIDMDIKAGEASDEQVPIKFGNQRQSQDGYPLMGSPANFIGGFGQYPIGEIGRFDAEQFTPRLSANGVSLTLGLPHCDNLSLSGSHHNFYHGQNILLGRRPDITEQNEFGAIDNSATHSSAAYDSVDIQTRKRFAAQLLPDFVT